LLSSNTHRIIEQIEKECSHYGLRFIYAQREFLQRLVAKQIPTDQIPAGLFIGHLHEDEYEEHIDLIADAHRACRPVTPSVVVYTAHHKRLFRPLQLLNGGNIGTTWARTIAQHLFYNGYSNVTLCYNANYFAQHTINAVTKIINELLNLNPQLDYRICIQSDPMNPSIDVEHYLKVIQQKFLAKYAAPSIESIRRKIVVTDCFTNTYNNSGKHSVHIFSRDSDAVELLEHYGRINRSAPEDGGILSLENSIDYARFGLATVLPDWETIGYLVAHALIGDFRPARTRRGYIKPSALLLRRKTLL
jgi:hypothetical protein